MTKKKKNTAKSKPKPKKQSGVKKPKTAKIKKRGKTKKKVRLKLYTKVVRITREEFKKYGLEIDYNKARNFVSKYLYADFKGKSVSSVKITEIRQKAKAAIEQYLTAAPSPPYQLFIDPRIIPEPDVFGIEWWDINVFLTGEGDRNIYQSRALQGNNAGKNLRFEVIADENDRTGELTLLEYDGVDSGVAAMIERIREAVNNESEPYFTGYLGKRIGKTDEDDPDTYVLQFILVVNGREVVEPDSTVTVLPQREMTEEEYLEYQRQLREKILKKDDIEIRKEEAAKARRRKSAKRPTKKKQVKEEIEEEIEEEAEPSKPKAKRTRADKILELTQQKIKELEMLRKDYDDKIINAKEYKRDRLRIMKQYEDAMTKMKQGGVV